MTEYLQHVLDEGKEGKNKITLEEFAKIAIEHLEKKFPYDNEVVKIANDIEELEHDTMTPPRNIYPLPNGYEYRFSGYFGQVVGICKIEK